MGIILHLEAETKFTRTFLLYIRSEQHNRKQKSTKRALKQHSQPILFRNVMYFYKNKMRALILFIGAINLCAV